MINKGTHKGTKTNFKKKKLQRIFHTVNRYLMESKINRLFINKEEVKTSNKSNSYLNTKPSNKEGLKLLHGNRRTNVPMITIQTLLIKIKGDIHYTEKRDRQKF